MNKNVEILLLAPPVQATGGIASWTRHILNYYSTIKSEDVSITHLPKKRSKFISKSSSFLVRAIYGVKDNVIFLIKLVRYLCKYEFDIVHITSSASLGLIRDVLFLRVFKIFKVKSVIHLHFGRIPELYESQNWEWRLINYVLKNFDLSIVLDELSHSLLSKLGYTKVTLVPNPLSTEVLNKIEDNKGIEVTKNKIVFAGHLLPSKGIVELVQACIEIPNIKLIILGKIPDRKIKKSLLNIASAKKDADWIEILGEKSIDYLIKEMMSSNVFVLPTYTEGFPNVILESMACSCAIVTTPVGAIPEMLNILSDKACGICVSPRDVVELKGAIESLLNDENLAIQYGKLARERVVEKYSISIIWDKLYDSWINLVY